MNSVHARKHVLPAAPSGPTEVHPTSPSEIAAILRNPRRYPSPLRAIGSASATTRCITANGGTLLHLSKMNRVLRIDSETVTVQPGITLPELAETLGEEGLELIGGFDLANRSVGGAVSAAGVEAAMAGDVGQFAAHVVKLKVLSPQGRKFEVNEKTKTLLGVLRLSYGLLGIVYEITLRVRPIQGFSVQSAKVGFSDFSKLAPRLTATGAGVKLYLLPFRDRIFMELRRPAPESDPGRKFAWRFKDWACYSALPEAAKSLARAVPIRQLRYPLIDSLSEAAQSLVNNALVKSGSNAVEQTGRFRKLDTRERFTYCTWAFPANRFGAVVDSYRQFCHEHYERTGFRCDMPAVSFRINRDRSSLLSPSFDDVMFTISPLTTQHAGWEDFVVGLAEFAETHAGVPFFNQTKGATAEAVNRCFGTRLSFFRKVRREFDGENRLLNQFFATYFL